MPRFYFPNQATYNPVPMGAPVAATTLGPSNLSVSVAAIEAPAQEAPAFTPTDVAGLQLWLDAAVGVTDDGLGNATAWADQSGNSNNASQGNGSYQPAIVTGAVNSLPVISFDGTNHYMDLPNNSVLTNGGPFSMFAVLKTREAGYYSSLVAFGSDGDKVAWNIQDDGLGNPLQNHYNSAWDDNTDVNSNTTIGTSAYKQIGSICAATTDDAGVHTFYLNGAADGARTVAGTSAIASDSMKRIGGDAGTEDFYGYLAELLIYNVAISGADATSVMNYQINKFAIS